jgi:short-subunit dehydrogenase
VTGASSGIGLEVARRFAAAGASVALVARTKAKLDEVARSLGARAAAFPLDVSDLAALEKLPADVAKKLGGCDVVVNNAGVNHRGPAADRTPAELVEVVTTNLSAPMVLSRAALPFMKNGGAIVNVASLAGMVPVPDEAAYCASKAGLRAFSRALGVELAPRGIHVGVVSPGPVDTPFFGDVSHVPPIVFSQPMSSPGEVAEAVIRCIEDRVDEIALPRLSGTLATVGYVFPSLARRLRPVLEKRGERNRARYMQSKRNG